MELDELHVLKRRTGVVRERVAVARVLPAVAGDAEGAAEAAGRDDDGFRAIDLEAATLAVVGHAPDDARVVLEERDDRMLHVDVDAAMDAVILQRADHLEAGAIADVCQPRIAVAAKVALEDAAVLGPVEHRAPRFELAHAIGRLLRVQLGHAPVVEVLAATHRVRKVDAPVVAVVDVGHRRGHAAFGHDSVRLAEQRLGQDADGGAVRRGFNGGAQSGAAGADDEHIVIDDWKLHL